MQFKLCIACLSVCILGLGTSFTVAEAATNKDYFASVELIDGPNAMVTPDGSAVSRQLKISDRIHEGDTIQTDPNTTVVIRFNASQIQIMADSEFRMEMQDETTTQRVFYLLRGWIHSLIHNDGSGDVKVKINTPTGTLGVRGTEFVMEYVPATSSTKVYMIEGVVSVAGPNAADSALTNNVTAPNEANVSASPGTPVPRSKDSIKTQFLPFKFRELHKAKPKDAAFRRQERRLRDFQDLLVGGSMSSAMAKLSEILSNGGPKDLNRRLNGRPLIQVAARRGWDSLVEQMITSGVDPNMTDGNGDTLAHILAPDNKYLLLERLAQYGNNPKFDLANNQGMTFAMIAALRTHKTSVRRVMDICSTYNVCPNLNIVNIKDGNKTVMDYALQSADTPTVDYFNTVRAKRFINLTADELTKSAPAVLVNGIPKPRTIDAATLSRLIEQQSRVREPAEGDGDGCRIRDGGDDDDDDGGRIVLGRPAGGGDDDCRGRR